MNKLHVATMDDFEAIKTAFKLYKKEGKFQYVRQDYLRRCIEEGICLFDYGVVAIIKQMKRSGWIGPYNYSAGEWNIHQILSIDKSDAKGPFIFMRKFFEEYVKNGIVYGTVHDTNKQSIAWHEALGFKNVGKIEWSGGTMKGRVYVYDRSNNVEKFVK